MKINGSKFTKNTVMKKLITLFFILFLGISLHAQQVDRDMVVVEGGTGFW